MKGGIKLGFTLFIMAAFTFGDSMVSYTTILGYIILILALVVMIMGLIFYREDKRNTIVITKTENNTSRTS